MIDEPRAGMRVRFIKDVHCGVKKGDTGTITRIDLDGSHKIQMDKEDDWHFSNMSNVTEIKENDMKKGDLVKIKDDSYAVRVDAYEPKPIIDTMHVFEVVGITCSNFRLAYEEKIVHDIFIKDKTTDRVYLHSSFMVKVLEKQYCEYCGKKLD
jgi:hypothetical protein